MTVIAPSVCQGSICARAVRQSSAGHFCPWHSHLTESLKQWPWLQPGWAVPYHTCARREYSSLRVHVPFLLIAITARQSIRRTLFSLLIQPRNTGFAARSPSSIDNSTVSNEVARPLSL